MKLHEWLAILLKSIKSHKKFKSQETQT
jgi:hypothetical protein